MKTKKRALIIGTIGMISLYGVSGTAATLQEAVQEALNANPEVVASIYHQKAKQEELQQAKSGNFPTVDLSVGVGKESSENSFTKSVGEEDYLTLTRSEAAIVVRQNLFSGFSTTNVVKSARAQVDSAGHAVSSTAQYTALNAINAYLSVLKNTQLLELSKQNLEAHEKIFSQIKSRSEKGVGRGADLDQTIGRLALANANVIADASKLQDARVNYQRVVGTLPDNKLSLPAAVDSGLPKSIDEAESEAKKNHPVLKSAESDIQSILAEQRGTRSSFYPSVDLVLSGGWNENIDGVEEENNDYSAMLQLRYNLFNGGRDSAKKKQAGHVLNQSKEIRSQMHREVLENLNVAWNTYKAIDRQLVYLKQHQDASVKTREAYRKQFSIGQRTLLDLLDTENEIFSANRALAEANYDSMLSQYRVFSGMGKLVEEIGVTIGGSK